jgi:hypothetical protein
MEMKERVMPRDVSTRWNSTYDMLDFALQHKEPLTRMTGAVENGLRQYEMTKREWMLADQLKEVLKVSVEQVADKL